MSPRNDSLLSLCLAQAELSPLHYRHGSVIVRGGKVIGQGFNCYRSGFDGGALKTGLLPTTSLDGAGLAELKEQLKFKTKYKMKLRSESDVQEDSGSCTFTPFESTGCGHNSNTPLSMHSEMMAIRSALSLSSATLSSQTSARSAKYFEKPCFSLPGDSTKRKARAPGIKAHTKAVCEEAADSRTGKAYGGKFSIQKQGFESGTSQPGVQEEQGQRQRKEDGERLSRKGAAVYGLETKEKCQETPNEKPVRSKVWVRVERVLSSSSCIQTLPST